MQRIKNESGRPELPSKKPPEGGFEGRHTAMRGRSIGNEIPAEAG